MNSRQQRIEAVLKQNLQPVHLVVENESHMHSVPAHSETHFKILVVSNSFENLSRIDRQRRVNELLKAELQAGLHALTQRLLTVAEWEKQQASLNFTSPACEGGSKHEAKTSKK